MLDVKEQCYPHPMLSLFHPVFREAESPVLPVCLIHLYAYMNAPFQANVPSLHS